MSSSVLVAVPNTGYIHKHVAFALLKLVRDSRVTVILPTHTPIENNRNLIVRDFLRGDFSHLLMFDADNPPSRNPLELSELDKDVMILPTPQWHLTAEDGALGKFPIYWNCMDEDLEGDGWKEHSPKSGLQEIDAGGSGCMLIARRVLEQIKRPFERTWDEDGVCVYGSDFWFCKKAKDHGFTIWAHYDYPCLHFKEVEMGEVHRSMMSRDISAINPPNLNTAEYWDKEWSKRPERSYPYHDKIVELCVGQRVLDFGCGRGDLLAKLGGDAFGVDISAKAVSVCRDRGLTVMRGSEPFGTWDTIIATELLEHVDDPKALLKSFFEHTDRVIYAVPNNCLPPGIEPEHRRVYNEAYVRQITPHLTSVEAIDNYLLVNAEVSRG